jgi:hypothetical protein
MEKVYHNNKIYEFTGQILGKHKKKVYNKRSEYYLNTYYRLQVELKNNPKLKEILVFPESKIWQNIEEAKYHGQRYLFYCSPKVSNYQIVAYQLVDWKELENHGSN